MVSISSQNLLHRLPLLIGRSCWKSATTTTYGECGCSFTVLNNRSHSKSSYCDASSQKTASYFLKPEGGTKATLLSRSRLYFRTECMVSTCIRSTPSNSGSSSFKEHTRAPVGHTIKTVRPSFAARTAPSINTAVLPLPGLPLTYKKRRVVFFTSSSSIVVRSLIRAKTSFCFLCQSLG